MRLFFNRGQPLPAPFPYAVLPSIDYSNGKGVHILLYAERNAAGLLQAPVLTANEAASLDLKLDDGAASAGLILSNQGDAATNACTNAMGAYLSSNQTACVSYFLLFDL